MNSKYYSIIINKLNKMQANSELAKNSERQNRNNGRKQDEEEKFESWRNPTAT